MKFSLASALGVGITSKCEFVEIDLSKDVDLKTTLEQLQAALPMGIHIIKGDLVLKTTPKLMASVAGAEYLINVPCDKSCKLEIEAFNTATSIIYHRLMHKGKVKFKDIEVKNFIKKIQGKWLKGSLELRFICKITSDGSIKAIELLKLLQTDFHIPLILEQADIQRINLFALNKEGHKKALIS